MSAKPCVELLDLDLAEGVRIADEMLSIDPRRPFSSTDFASQGKIKVLIIQETNPAKRTSSYVGFCTLNQGTSFVELARLYVIPDARRRGIGEAAVLQVFHYLAPFGLTAVGIDVREPDALRFWESATDSLDLDVTGGGFSSRWTIYAP
ncbi:GNAT family N-acetyltransferase [Pseudomonas amygdali]|uniref:GNAT family N-acetyltransferase n=1 Tax=Pseudomonas amygdali TaxID=47877 RepID=UPI001C575BD2|nr:GNAT family N-acetyltransferase [Pseudomonas amygdali]QXW46883.1 GNAT family N-acetyltransferase [Pseudomonas amygdali]